MYGRGETVKRFIDNIEEHKTYNLKEEFPQWMFASKLERYALYDAVKEKLEVDYKIAYIGHYLRIYDKIKR